MENLREFLINSDPTIVSKILMGQLTEYSVELLRHMKTFLGVTFRLEQVDEGKLKPYSNPRLVSPF